MSDSGEQNYGERESRSASRSGSAHGSGKSARHTPARSRSKEDSRRSRSKSRSRSESRSRSRRSSRRHYTRSRSRSRSHRRSRSRSYSRDYRRRHSHSHSPMSTRRRHVGNRANPDPNCCLGVFGLSLYTTERDLREVFSKYGPIADVSIVYDQQSRRSRGFAFVYFENVDDAKEAKERANGMELDGRRIRVDFSITKRPHTPTPGIYMGRPTYSYKSYLLLFIVAAHAVEITMTGDMIEATMIGTITAGHTEEEVEEEEDGELLKTGIRYTGRY
ncbi:hypothetical protein EI555_021171 [Monodon monoceros]|uniref:Transformer-2 protein homolog beta n=1 Tax=Monodon monoceros TaxID=40151 RepID=A0A4U1FI27_MONMO|nr:hypothetical protein EI555_021171 [Monodon monoceros]